MREHKKLFSQVAAASKTSSNKLITFESYSWTNKYWPYNDGNHIVLEPMFSERQTLLPLAYCGTQATMLTKLNLA